MMQRMSREEFLYWTVYYDLKAEAAKAREEEQEAKQAELAAQYNKQ